MKIIDNITNGYRKIASGIAIVAFLTLMYFALIPGGTMAAVISSTGVAIPNAFIKLVDYPQYNATTDVNGNYTLNNVPYDGLTPAGSTYIVRASAAGYGSNSTSVTLTAGSPNPAANFELYPSVPKYITLLNDQGNYNSSIQIFNPFNFNTTEDITAYNVLGGITTESFEVPVNRLGSKNPSQIAKSNFVGSIMVNNTRPESIVQGIIKTISTGTYSIAPSTNISADTIQYIPFLNDRNTQYDSGIQIFNPNTGPITVDLTGYNVLNGLITTLSFTIPGNSFGSKYAGEVAGGAIGANVDFVGAIKVVTSQPALVQGNLRTLATGTASVAPARLTPTDTIQYITILNDRGTQYDSGIQVFNPNTGSITVDLTGYNVLNGLTTTLSFTIPGNSFGSKYAGEVAGGAIGANVDFVGGVKVVTSQPALVQGNIRTLATGTVSIAPARPTPIDSIQFIPFLHDTGTQYDSGIQVFNPNTGSITVDLTGYNELNGLTTTLSFTIPGNSFGSKYAGEVAGGAIGANVDFVGGVKVVTSQPALVQGNIRTLADGTASIATSAILK